MTKATREDIVEMLRDGSFGEFLRHQIAVGRTVTQATDVPPTTGPRDPSHRPGAWPVGTRPPVPDSPPDPAAHPHAVCDCDGCRALSHPAPARHDRKAS